MNTPMSTAPPPPPPPPDAPPEVTPRARLVRSRDDRLIGGVAGGIAQTYGFDPGLVRLAFVAVGLVTVGMAAVAYALAWLVIPDTPGGEPLALRWRHERPSLDGIGLWVGLAVAALGVIALASALDEPFGDAGAVLGPLLLIGLGAAILLRPGRRGATVSTDDAPPSAYPAGSTWPGATDAAPAARAPKPRRERSLLGPLALSLLLVAVGVAWLLDVTGAVAVPGAVVNAVALGIVGMALLVGAFIGRARGLVALGVVLSTLAIPLALVEFPLGGFIGEQRVQPRTTEALRSEYHVAAGQLVIDLRRLEGAGIDDTVTVTAGAGEVRVLVPEDLTLEVRGRAEVGEIRIPGLTPRDGSDLDVRSTVHPGAPRGVIRLDARVAIGAITVREVPAQFPLGSELDNQGVQR